jgi:pyocin large subunit-like protein
MKMKVVYLIGAGALALSLGACDAGPAATSKTPVSTPATTPASSRGVVQTSAVDPRDLPAPIAADGKPIWAPNSKHTAQENADYQFGKNGKDFGALSEADYVAKTHAFVDAPPPGVQKVERANGDALFYDGKTNTFAVVAKTGAPRTMFKPRDGAAYWRQQVARETARNKGADKSES